MPTLYSSVFGGFEFPWPPLRQPEEIRTLLVSDSSPGVTGWNDTYSPPETFDTARLANRFHKMLHYSSLTHDDFSVYVDANVRPINSLSLPFEAFEESGADIGMYRHYSRSNVKDEASACLSRNKVSNPAALAEELALYDSLGFPDDQGMWEGSVIFRRNSSQHLGEAMHDWWELYSRFQTRDQFSLPFVIWKHGLKVFDLDDHSPGREHYFVRLQHSQSGLRNRLARYLQARAPENSFWSALHRAGQTFAGSHTAKE